ncbi:unnamed protein product [Closterium sp. NIES-54]
MEECQPPHYLRVSLWSPVLMRRWWVKVTGKVFHSMVGALNYAANHTRPDIAFPTSRLAGVVSRPSHEQLEAAKRLVRYVSATASVGLEYSAVRQRQQRGAADLGKGEMLLTCYTDASFNSVKADGTSIGGYVCLFGGGAGSWSSKKQNEVGLSSCETEYMVLHHGVEEVVWLRCFLEEIGVCPSAPSTTSDTAPAATAPTTTAATLLLHTVPLWPRFDFSHSIMRAVYDAVVACYSSPTTAALGRLLLPYMFPELSTFATVEDLVSHLRASDARNRAAVPTEFLDKNQPSMFTTLYFIVTRLPDSLRSVRDHFLSLDPTSLTFDLLEKHLLAAETSALAVGAARGTPRLPFFEGCSPSPLAPSYACAAVADVSIAEDFGAASASAKRHSGKGKGGKGGGGGSGGGGGGSGSSGGGSSGGGGGSGTVGGSGGSGGGGGGSGGSGGGGGSGTGGGGTRALALHCLLLLHTLSSPAVLQSVVPHPECERARAASPTVSCLLVTAVTGPSFESASASTLVAELLDIAAACRLDHATALVAESASASPPSIGGECALGTDVLEDRQEDFECLAATVPCFAFMLLAPEEDPDAPDIPTPRSYAKAITGPYSSQWQAAMDAEMASWKSTGTYVDEVPPPGANIVNGMWIFRVKGPPGSPPAFKARYVAQGFRLRQGADYFQTFSPTPKMTTLRVLLHVAAQRDYELHSLDFSKAFLQGSLHEEIWLRRPPGFNDSSPAGTQWSLRRPVYGLRQAPCEWHDTLRTTLAKWVLRYLCSTSGMGLVVGGRDPIVLTGHADASWVDDSATQRSSQGYTFSLGSGSVSWWSTHSSSVLSSSCEAEIYAGAMAAQELRWLTYLLIFLGEQPRSPLVLYVDNKAMIALCQEHRLEHRTKHIALRYFLARELQ